MHVRQTAALELLREEAAVEGLQPLQDHIRGVGLPQGIQRQTVDLPGREAPAEHVVQEEVV